MMEVLDGLMEPGRSLLAGAWGDPGWGAADCAVQAHLAYLPVFFPQLDLSPYPRIQAVIEAVRQRPAYLRGLGQR
jgi:glutathione S-transferase